MCILLKKKDKKFFLLSGDRIVINQKQEDGQRENGNMSWYVESCQKEVCWDFL